MSLLEKASSNPESSSSEEKKFRHIIRKPLGRRSEGNLKAASKGKRAEEQHPTTSFDVPPPPPPKDPVPVGIPIKGRSSDKVRHNLGIQLLQSLTWSVIFLASIPEEREDFTPHSWLLRRRRRRREDFYHSKCDLGFGCCVITSDAKHPC